jgi:hypothetical protein
MESDWFSIETVYSFNFYTLDLVYREVKLRFFLKYRNLNREKGLEFFQRFVRSYNVFNNFTFV